VVAAAAAAVFVPQLGSRSSVPGTITAAGWTPVRTLIAFQMTVDPTRPDHLLAGGFGQVYESWNAGGTWHQVGALPPRQIIRDIAIDASAPTHYLVATKHSVFVSQDAGAHWSVAATGLTGAMNMFLMQDPQNAGTFYLGPSTLWKSIDHGLTWRPAGPGHVFAPWGIQTLATGPGGALYTGVWGNGVAVSHDGGATWHKRARGLAPDVVSVAAGPGLLLAGTDQGIYRSTDSGHTWRRSGPGFQFFTTSVFEGQGYQLAGGSGGVFRSTHEGRRWKVSGSGLPLYPYIYSFVGDPRNPNRVYASLDGDGVFRSKDAGRHWQAINSGLPITGHESLGQPVLFRRNGALWLTDDLGTDPLALTVDTQVRLAAVAPDGVSVAYVNGANGGWAVRAVNAGGSRALTLASGTDTLPSNIEWSPDSVLVAIVSGDTMRVANLTGKVQVWAVPPSNRFVGWTPALHDLLFWNTLTHRLIVRDPAGGATVGANAANFGGMPVLGSDGSKIALASAGALEVGSLQAGVQPAGRLSPSCSPAAWSASGISLLVTCRSGIEILSASGSTLGHAALPTTAQWSPGSDTDLLYSHAGALWRWSPGHSSVRIVPNARGVASGL
jgi:hypothetical protein